MTKLFLKGHAIPSESTGQLQRLRTQPFESISNDEVGSHCSTATTMIVPASKAGRWQLTAVRARPRPYPRKFPSFLSCLSPEPRSEPEISDGPKREDMSEK
jgi:hypothetical protein